MKKFFLILALLCSPVFALAAPDAPAPQKEKQAPENWKKLFGRDLFDADGKKVAVSKAIKKKYVAIYSSASWCGPCRAFTPKLIEFYKKGTPIDDPAVIETMKNSTIPQILANVDFWDEDLSFLTEAVEKAAAEDKTW